MRKGKPSQAEEAHIKDESGSIPDDLDSLTSVQQRAITALLTEPTISKAAEACGVGESTLRRWLRQDQFVKVFRTARRESFAQAIALAQRYTPLAVNTLAKIMSDLSLAASARVSAATAVLKFGRESIELDDLAARIDALERVAEITSSQRGGR